MGIFGFGKKDKIIDLTGKFPQKEKEPADTSSEYMEIAKNESSQKEQSTVPTAFGFFGNTPQTTNPESNETNYSENPNEQKRKLAKRLMDMTAKLEDVSNQIYHLQQRIEVVEKKLDLNRF